MSTKLEIAEKPTAALDKTPPKAMGAAVGSAPGAHAPQAQPAAAPKRSYPTLGYE